ncbi:LytTR family DNA-binding domain-containing protein [Ruminococcus sp.]|uniref:LytR/AlgR family response regulator transcription factor n=1 Tax=Ruminococcus sp. TaxID=41978 RepID=UPI0025884F63|nr:LytTR family DNA-binding domain-containing protein [Ruminococcus sp.]MCR5020899.1 LytTR family DNA-binding domain-containing protein [Ruminococcus sp.]
MKLKAAICDDEIIIAREIMNELNKLCHDYSIDIYTNGNDLIHSATHYDLIFLDIEMPELDGMKTAEQIRANSKGEYIIFLTSHTEFMPDAFKVKAFRFLIKPIDFEKFNEAVIQAEKEILNDEKISISEKGRTRLIDIKDIICIEAFGDGTYVHTKYEAIENNKPLKYWKDILGNDHFYQTHKSYIVAFRYVKCICVSDIEMQFMTERPLISRRKQSEFNRAFFDYVKINAKIL